MNKNKNNCIDISAEYIESFDMICSDENNIYLICENMNFIYVVNNKTKEVNNIILPFNIYRICYDCINEVFICSINKMPDVLVVFNKCGEVCDKINICNKIDGICERLVFDKMSNTITILDSKNNIYILSKCNNLVNIKKRMNHNCITDMKICDEYIFIFSKNEIFVYDKCFNLIKTLKVKENIGQVFVINRTRCESKFIILIFKGDVCNIKFSKYCINLCNCNTDENLCNCNEQCDCCICDNTCNHECDQTVPTSCGNYRSIYDIVESIALEETGLAHIINAEGEKIQKAVCICKNCDELIKINTSVQNTLSKVIELEMILNGKLKLAYDMMIELELKCTDECE